MALEVEEEQFLFQKECVLLLKSSLFLPAIPGSVVGKSKTLDPLTRVQSHLEENFFSKT